MPSREQVSKRMPKLSGSPFGGLFGDTAELRVLQEIVADPFSDYTHHDLMELTELSDPSVRRGLHVLLDQGIVANVSNDRRSPLYRPNRASKKLTALTFLAYAILDDENGENSMDMAVKGYCEPRAPYIDFYETPTAKKEGVKDLDGARVYLSQEITRDLRGVLREILKKGCKEGRLDRITVSP